MSACPNLWSQPAPTLAKLSTNFSPNGFRIQQSSHLHSSFLCACKWWFSNSFVPSRASFVSLPHPNLFCNTQQPSNVNRHRGSQMWFMGWNRAVYVKINEDHYKNTDPRVFHSCDFWPKRSGRRIRKCFQILNQVAKTQPVQGRGDFKSITTQYSKGWSLPPYMHVLVWWDTGLGTARGREAGMNWRCSRGIAASLRPSADPGLPHCANLRNVKLP